MSSTHREYKDKGFIEDQREFFDKLITRDWDTYVNPEWDRERQCEVYKILNLIHKPVRTVLDIGCGSGYHDMIFAERDEIQSVVGVDNSFESIRQAEEHYPHKKVQRFVADIFSMDQIINDSGKFDLVTSFQVIEHLKDPQAFLSACRQCVMGDGHVAVVTPNRLRFENRFRSILGRQPVLIDPMHFKEYSVPDLVTIGRNMGLEFVGSFAHSIYVPHLKLPFSLQIGTLLPGVATVIGVMFKNVG